MAKRFLEEQLPDANKFKPRVWATHKITGLFGVSLAVGSLVRPLFLFIKLVQLRKLCNADCQLKDTEAFRLTEKNTKSKYVTEIKPCASCALFFDGSYEESRKFPVPFGNCAEYDVNQTGKLDLLLSRRFERHAWDTFKEKCQNYLEAFRVCLGGENVDLTKYLERKATNSKVLRYKWLISRRLEGELEAQDWPRKRS